MTWWSRLTGKGSAPTALTEALAAEEETRSELLEVVAELEAVVARLSSLPEVQIARRDRRKGDKR